MAVLQIILFQTTNKTNLLLPNQSIIPIPKPAGGHQRPSSEALKLLFYKVLTCDARWLI
jgi:hypothetical protein